MFLNVIFSFAIVLSVSVFADHEWDQCRSEAEKPIPSTAAIHNEIRTAAKEGRNITFSLEDGTPFTGIPSGCDLDFDDNLLSFLITPDGENKSVVVDPKKINAATFVMPLPRPRVIVAAAAVTAPKPDLETFIRDARRSADEVTFKLENGDVIVGQVNSSNYTTKPGGIEVMETVSVSFNNGGARVLKVSEIVGY